MASSSTDIYLSKAEQERVRKLLEHTGTVTDYLSKAADYVKDGKGMAEALTAAAPWLKDVAEAAGESFPAIKFVLKLGEKWLPKATHPTEVGAVACTIVYQKLADKAIKAVWTSALGYKQAMKVDEGVAKRIKTLPPAEAADLSTFSYETALQHGFIRNANRILEELMLECGFDQKQQMEVFNSIHENFVTELKALLADSRTATRFEPFKAFLESGSDERQAQMALRQHAKYQIAQYESEPLFKREPYALKDVYVETECGALTWKQIRKPEEKAREGGRSPQAEEGCDPFSENYGGRQDLLNSVMERITNKDFREAIVVQGIAGAGKSSFTLRLCAELWKQGFHPIRIRFKRLQLGASLYEALNDAIELTDDDRVTELPIVRPKDMLRDGDIFKTPWGGAHWLSRYVLILDGWDELDLTDNKSFREKVSEVLRDLRQRFLGPQQAPRVRVIVTGRPSPDVNNSRFLNDETPILTLRPIRPAQLQDFIARLKHSIDSKPVAVEQADEWSIPDPAVFGILLERYALAFDQSRPKYDKDGEITERGVPPASGSFEVVGLPLLAYLTVRVLSEMAAQEPDETGRREMFDQIVDDPTTLYRCLTDLTCEKAGKAALDARDSTGDLDRQAREKGKELRKKLQYTAAAMSISGTEYISFSEWAQRVAVLSNENLVNEDSKTEDHPLAKLMISYYFKGGHQDQSCEFAHKSFREYLFAEAIVEAVKKYGLEVDRHLNPHRPYWRDFSASDKAIHEFSRSLAMLLSPQWLSPEVYRHVLSLLHWEINRTQYQGATFCSGLKTEELSLDKWQRVRDGLAELWAWWADGAHLRPQILRQRIGTSKAPPYVQELIFWAAFENGNENTPLESTNSMDAHLGDALCQLNAMVHFFVALSQGFNWQDWKAMEPVNSAEAGKYQVQAWHQGKEIKLFAPGTVGMPELWNPFFKHWIARINSALGRPLGEFPSRAILVGASLDGASLDGAILYGASLSGASLDDASLVGAILDDARLVGASLDGASLVGASLDGASLDDASLDDASLDGASLLGASLDDANLSGASLDGAKLFGADLSKATGLTWEQIDAAYIDKETKLPEEFAEQARQKLARQWA
jgi:hypothetical protein